jgi:ssDNA-binding Zn-finger/Zn-ribbon topoisomerase 1
MKLQFEIQCSSCGSGDVSIKQAQNGTDIVICENPECEDYQCFWELELYFEDAQVIE